MTRPRSTLRALLLSLAVSLFPPLASAQTVLSTATIGSGPSAIVVDPVADKTYIGQHGSPGSVRVIDNATGAATSLLTGAIGLPTTLAVDPTLDQVIVGGQAGAAFIDGSTLASTPIVFQSPPATPAIVGAAVLAGQTQPFAVLTDSANNTAWFTIGPSAARFTSVGTSLTCPGPVTALPAFDIYIANPCTTSVVEFFGPGGTPKTLMLAGNPVAIAANPVTHRVYVAETGSSVDVIDGTSLGAPVLLAPITGMPSTATAIAVNPATNKIYVANGGANAVTIINGADNTKTSVTVGTNPVGISIDSVRNQVYVVNQGSATVTVIDGTTNAASSPLGVGAFSNVIAVNPLTSRVFTASISGNTLTTIDGRQYTDGTLPYAAVAAAVNPLTQRAYLAVSGTPGVVKVLDETDDSLVTTVTVGSNPTRMAVDLSLNRIYVIDGTDLSVTAINGADNTVAGTVTLEANPGAVVVNPSTHKLYVAHSGTGHVSIIDGTNLAAPVTTANVGGTPVGLALGEAVNRVFVVDAAGSTATVPSIDGTTNAAGITFINTALPVSDIAVDPTNGHLFVAHPSGNVVEESQLISDVPFPQYGAVNLYTVTNPTRLAVNKANHRVYVTSGTNLAAIAPSTNFNTGVTTATLSQAPLFVAVDDYADRVLVSGSSGFILVDGQSLHPLSVANTTTASGPGLAAIDPSIAKAYVPSSADVAVHVVKETTAISLASDAVTLAAMAGGHVTSAADPVIQLTNCCNTQTLIALNSAPDGPHGGTTTVSASASNLLSAELTGIAPALHFVTLYYLDATTGTSIDPLSGSSGGTSIMIGRPTIFPVLKVNAPTVVTSALVAGKVGVPYNQSVSAIGGAGGLTFSLAGGALPDGLSLASDGTISGTPTLAGIFSFAIAVVDGSGGSNAATTGISITAGTLAASPGSVAFGNVVAAQPQTQAVTIVNNGTGTTHVSGTSITVGSDVFTIPSDGCTSTPLAHNQTCAIQVSFTPAAGGPRTGTLHLTTTDAGATTIDVPLTGTGVFMLTVVTNGTGTGSMTSSSPGIACPGDCTEIYAAGTPVTLTEVVGVGSNPMALTGCDTKVGFQCNLTMNGNRTVTATFTAIVPSVVSLEGWQEVPYVDTGAHGTATLVFDSFAQDLNVQWALTGLTGTLTAVTINGPAARGASGAVLHTLSTATIGNEHVTLAPSEVTAAQAGQLYINVTTTGNPNGQIRGQIDGLGAVTVRSIAALTLGSGSGTVTGTTEAGDVISCGSTCFASIPDGKSITFAVAPAPGSLFSGWGGACSGTGTCQVTMNGGKVVSATFNLVGAPTTTLSPSASTLVAGSSLTLTATLSGGNGAPTGSVTFLDGATSLGTVALDGSGHAAITTSTLTVGSHSLTVSYPGDGNYAAATSAPVTVDVTAPAPADPARLGNISTRMEVLTGDNVMIAGFTIGGSTPKTLAITATGPSLAGFGIANPLANPTLTLVRQSDHATIATNDDWQTDANAAQLTASGFAPTDPHEAGLYVTLDPGAYTAIVSGANGGVGVSVAGVFEVDHPEVPLTNISTRGEVLTGDNVMIAGIIVQGSGPQTVVITATGPSLASFGIANPLPNPMLTLVRQSDHATIASNDDWQTNVNAADITASGFAPTDPHESALLVTLDPGAYTAIVQGVGGATGVSVVGVFTTGP